MERDFRVGPVHISATRKGLPQVTSNLTSVLRLMDLANLYGKRIDHRTWEAIRKALSQRPPGRDFRGRDPPVPVVAEPTGRAARPAAPPA